MERKYENFKTETMVSIYAHFIIGTKGLVSGLSITS